MAERKMSQKALSDAIGKSQSQISQWFSGVRQLGDGVARNVEMSLNLPQGWLDDDTLSPATNHANLSSAPREQTIADHLESLRTQMASASPEVQQALAALVGQYMAKPDAESGRAIAEAITRLIGKP